MSSLRKQLAVIHANSTNELDLRAQKAAYSKSLLFEPKVAASQSLDVLYQLCYEGFEELCALDSRFMRFERSIFSPQSKAEDRQLMTKKENEELDAVLESFLGLVGARLQLKPAMKAMEWLVRRFRIHEHNTEAVILTFLPYHATPIFPTLLSILPKQLSPTLKFLHPYISQLASPPRAVIVFTAVHNQNFFSAFNRYVLNVAKAQHTYHVLISFWASIIAQTTNDMLETSASGRQNIQRQRVEDVLTRLLPVLNEALGVKSQPELTIGCYMLVTILVCKASLEDSTLDALLAAVVQTINVDIADTALGCLAVIAEQRQSISLPRGVFRRLIEVEELPQRLEHLASEQPAHRLVAGILHGVLSRMSEEVLPQALPLLKLARSSSIITDNQRDVLVKQLQEKLADSDIAPGAPEGIRRQLLASSSLLTIENTLDEHDVITHTDAMEVDAADDGNTDNLDTADDPSALALHGIPESAHVPHGGSFLVAGKSSDVELQSVFEALANSKKSVSAYVQLPFLSSISKGQQLSPFSFFVRVWCTSLSAIARTCALEFAADRLATSGLRSAELFALLPSAIYALADQSRQVRRSAAGLLKQIDRQSRNEFDGESTEKQEFSTSLKLLYGSSAGSADALTVKTATNLLEKAILPAVEECVTDPVFIQRHLSDALDQSSSPKFGGDLASDRLKSSQKGEVFAFLCCHMGQTSLYAVKIWLLQALSSVRKVAGQSRWKLLHPCVQSLVALTGSQIGQIHSDEHITGSAINSAIVATVHAEEVDAVDYLLSLLQGKTTTGSVDLQKAAAQRLRAIWSDLKRTKQKSVLESVLSASLSNNESSSSAISLRDEALGVLKSLNVPSDLLVAILEESVGECQHLNAQPATKRRKTAVDMFDEPETKDGESKKALTRLTLVLELTESSKSSASIDLFNSLFRVLQLLQDLRLQTSSDLGYLQNLILESLSASFQQLDKPSSNNKLDVSLVRVDLLVDCIQKTTSAQSRNLALLLLSRLTKHIPQAVLHSIMPIFTLMSTTTVRQSDEFSAHVVDQVIQEVVPVLAQTLREQKKDLISATAEILLGFAAAFEHTAPHRRLHMYGMLARSLGVEESLYAIIATLVDRFPSGSDVDRFAANLCRQVSSVQALTTTEKHVILALDSLQPKPTLAAILLKKDDTHRGGLAKLLSTVIALLQDAAFRAKLKQDLKSSGDTGTLRRLFASVLEAAIRLVQASAAQHHIHDLAAKVLQSVLALFPLDELSASLAPLLDSTEDVIPRTVLETLQQRVRKSKQADLQSKAAVLGLLPKLVELLQDGNRPTLKLHALACIDQICEQFGKADPTATLSAADAIASNHGIGSPDSRLRVLSLHCVASCVEILGNEFIPLLQRTSQAALECLSSSLDSSTRNARLHDAAFAYFMALADHVPFMFGRAILRSVLELSNRSAASGVSGDAGVNRLQFLQLAATRIDIAVLLETAGETWQDALTKGFAAAQEHVEMVKATIENHSKTAISSNSRLVFSIVMRMLDVRRTCSGLKNLYTSQQLEALENAVLSVFLALVLKINDALFRPFFIQLLDWSSTQLPTSDESGKIERSITLFNAVTTLSERLKSIFTSYFGYLVDRAKDILSSSTPASKDKDSPFTTLNAAVLRALMSSFKHDQDDFWQSPAHFTSILTPLTSTLSSPTTSVLAIPVITELAAAAASPDHHRDLNRSLLTLLRSSTSARTRLAAVKCQRSLVERLGDEWLGNLPEMLPVINELQDDGDETVERETEKWIKLVEGVLGERLDSMLQ